MPAEYPLLANPESGEWDSWYSRDFVTDSVAHASPSRSALVVIGYAE